MAAKTSRFAKIMDVEISEIEGNPAPKMTNGIQWMENRAQDHLQLEPKIIYRYETCRMWVKNFPSAHYHQMSMKFSDFLHYVFVFSLESLPVICSR